MREGLERSEWRGGIHTQTHTEIEMKVKEEKQQCGRTKVGCRANWMTSENLPKVVQKDQHCQ